MEGQTCPLPTIAAFANGLSARAMSGSCLLEGGDFSGGGWIFSYSFGIFRAWQHSTRCFLSDSIGGQKEGSACYQ